MGSSTFCQSCQIPPPIFRANVVVEGTEAKYNCSNGFLMKFPTENTQASSKFWVRKCLKTGEWEANQPICTSECQNIPQKVKNAVKETL